jgi:hypothetical protein
MKDYFLLIINDENYIILTMEYHLNIEKSSNLVYQDNDLSIF